MFFVLWPHLSPVENAALAKKTFLCAEACLYSEVYSLSSFFNLLNQL